LNAVDKGLARLDFASQLPRPGGVATVLTKRGPEESGCYSPLIGDNLLIFSRNVKAGISSEEQDLSSQQGFISPGVFKEGLGCNVVSGFFEEEIGGSRLII
jgi:hypothetical protein